MKKITTALFITIYYFSNAQIPLPPTIKERHTTSAGLKISSRKSTLIEKEIIDLAKFKNINIQKIVLKDLADNSTETVLGLMTEYETFDNISKRTLTVEKPELSKWIESLAILEQKENERIGNSNKKYKFVLNNNIEVGGVYKENEKIWINYFKFYSDFYSKNIEEFSKAELKELIKILKKAEQDL